LQEEEEEEEKEQKKTADFSLLQTDFFPSKKSSKV
jgi:hypothetical protein